ncbi:hypothetical protein ACFFOM_00700 [Microlunatus capsulatus]|uniref:Uncharacterized protein n=1 Tax=Microlunatus capsulatus TaxID=99117 RepID=A0ABS4Z3Z5_9ACTN|nr:hypothetical protein [Microlunatus capsulatus]MBP2415763.1 hypothetical protein [Microlunatus capsulatus]
MPVVDRRPAVMGLRDWFARLGGRPDPAPGAPARPRTPTAEDIGAALDGVEQLVAGGAVPPLVQSRVRRVVGTVRDTVPRLRNLGPGSAQAYSVVATATDYLPQALSNYTRLPRAWADSRPIEGGKTSLLLLVDQLDLLAATMDQVLDAVVRVDADALIAHGRFLQEKFGHLDAPAPLDAPPAPGPRSSLDLP